MKSHFRILVLMCAVLSLTLSGGDSWADPIAVSYTVSGSAGNFELDFTVTNNLTDIPNEDVYFFGVKLDNLAATTDPTGYASNVWTTWNNDTLGYGGSPIDYNAIWIDLQYNHLLAGDSLSGFKVHVNSLIAPLTVNWFAFATNKDGTVYKSGGNLATGDGNDEPHYTSNPGFEGLAEPSLVTTIPEPTSLSLAGIGGMVLAISAFRRRRANRT